MPVTACFKADQLKSFALGRLNDEQAQQVAAHLQKCADCEQTLGGFDDTNDSLMLQIRSASAMAGAEECPAELERALGEIATSRTNTKRPVFQPTGSNDDWVRDYRLLEQLGQGGMGTVYKAIHERLQRTVALKLLPAKRLRNNEAVGRFEREMRAIGRLDHPAIVRATDAGEVDGTHFLAMDYVPGIDVSKVVRFVGPLRVPDACEIVRQAAVGLSYAHGQGLIHRDVKPSNIMLALADVGEEVNVRLLDLGLALFGAASEAVDDFTTVGQLMGTLDYMAPEQADHSRVDQTADVYSLGSTLFKLLTGKAPFETGEYQTPLQKMKALATVEPPSLLDRPCEASAELAAVVDQMVQRDPKQRIPTTAEVATAVQPFCEGHALRELALRAIELNTAAEIEAESRIPESIMRSTPGSMPEAKQQPTSPAVESAGGFDGNGNTRWKRWLAGFAAVPVLALLAGVIWIRTDKGTLKIESIADDIPIEIRQGTQLVESLILKSGPNEILLRSGQHEVSIAAPYDNLTISNSTVEIERGGQTIVRIKEVKNAATSPVAALAIANPVMAEATQVPVFEGKTYDQWKTLLELERSPVERRKAIEALAALCDEENTASTCDLILSILNQYQYPASETGSTDELYLFVSGTRVIREMNPNVVVEVLLKNLKTDRSNSNRLIVGALSGTDGHGPKGAGNPYPLYRALTSNTKYVNAIAGCSSHWRREEDTRGGQVSRLDAYSNFLALATNQAAAGQSLSREVIQCCEAILQDEASWSSDWFNNGEPSIIWGKAAYVVATDQPRADVMKRLAGRAHTEWNVWRALAIPNKHFETVLPVLAKQFGTLHKSSIQIGNEHFRLHRSTLAVEIFGLSGPAAKRFLPMIESEIAHVSRQSVSSNGQFAFVHDYQPKCVELTTNLHPLSKSTDLAAAFSTHCEALLWAYEKIAGHPAKFDSAVLPRFDAFEFETRPTLASYKGRSISEWARFEPRQFESWKQEQDRLKVLRLSINDAEVQAKMEAGREHWTRFVLGEFHDDRDWFDLVRQLLEEDDQLSGVEFEKLFATAIQPEQESLFLNVLTGFSEVSQPEKTEEGANLPETLMASVRYRPEWDEVSQSWDSRSKIEDVVNQLVINFDKTTPALQPEILRALTAWQGKLSEDAIGRLKAVFTESSELSPLAALTLGEILPANDADRSAVIDYLIEAVATGDQSNAYWVNAASSLAKAIQFDISGNQLDRLFEIMADSESSKSYTVLVHEKGQTPSNLMSAMMGGSGGSAMGMTGLTSLTPASEDTQSLTLVSRRSLVAEILKWSSPIIQAKLKERSFKRLAPLLSPDWVNYRTSSDSPTSILATTDPLQYFVSIASSEEPDEELFTRRLIRLMKPRSRSGQR